MYFPPFFCYLSICSPTIGKRAALLQKSSSMTDWKSTKVRHKGEKCLLNAHTCIWGSNLFCFIFKMAFTLVENVTHPNVRWFYPSTHINEKLHGDSLILTTSDKCQQHLQILRNNHMFVIAWKTFFIYMCVCLYINYCIWKGMWYL